ncbi:Hsp20 family protein [Spartinivicinus poritis]|uniref:Hsp20 family protein n=1 Tax=Spartinivicinus poritis TaxID=2994640 RepID=A0ABT5U8X2_9GAMM|nr:Hsp20 family protein [Spartinivicinus sp. A2-2]MDE1461893.1 Hsp20 family protein [Spartinivicinus sp. A2-2]
MRNNHDFSPFYRSAIGFDRLFSLLDNASRTEQNQPAYPPYNIELIEENKYQISMAVAGFSQDELHIEVEQNTLSVSGKKQTETNKKTFLYQGIAARNFERRFQLADHVKVITARLENGLLHIELEREVPETMKPRKVAIESTESKPFLTEAKAS